MSPPQVQYCVSKQPVRKRKKHNRSPMERNKDKYPVANPQRQEHQNISHLPSSPCQLYNESVYSVSPLCFTGLPENHDTWMKLSPSTRREQE